MMLKVSWLLPLLVAAAHALQERNFTNIFSQRSLGADAEDLSIRKSPTTEKPEDGPRFRPGEIIISGSPLDLPSGIKVKKYNKRADVTVVKVTPGREKELVKRLRDKGKEAEENFFMYASMVPDDPYFDTYQWHMTRVQATQAWDITTGEGVIVAVLDTGLANGNKLTADKKVNYDGITCIKSPYNTVKENTFVDDKDGHGTHVAGTIGQKTNNGKGAAGLAHGSCIMPVKVLDDNGEGDFADIAEGIRYAVDNGAKVINMSLGVDANVGMRRDNGVVDKALKYAYAKGVTVVAAAGNEGVLKNIGYPAIYPTVIAVGAVDYNNKRASYSNAGDGIDFVAPGGDTYQDYNGDGYGDGILQETFKSGELGLHFYQGTSMASPHVAAAAALLISAGVAKTPDEVRNALKRSAKDLGKRGFDRTYGHGLIQVHNALTGVVSNPPVDNSGTQAACWTLKGKRWACRRRPDCKWLKNKKCRNK